jgi:uncharacterized protein YbjT (DUF2867 family)
MKALMVGASGKLAGMVLPELKKRGKLRRALVRAEEDEAYGRRRGADEVAIGELKLRSLSRGRLLHARRW